MEKRFVNFSNHPSSCWSKEQLEAARQYGEIIDVPFPSLDSDLCEEDIVNIGDKYLEEIMQYEPAAVMCQGEFTLTFYVVINLIKEDIVCLSACTKRVSHEICMNDGSVQKTSVFLFERFRRYVGEAGYGRF